MDRTIIRNFEGTDTEPGQQNWRVRLGSTWLKCPLCDKWFKVPSDIEIDDKGNLSAVIYHFCDDEENEHQGWTVLAQLEGWRS